MNVLSLFDGMSCGQIALKQLNIPISNYYASEIDKYAIQVTQANNPDTIQLGDITKWREWGIDWSSIDLVFGGSPCQGFSFAGKQLAFDDPRSKLFFVFIDILNYIKQHNPNVKFLLENVRMKKEYQDVISKYIGVEPVMINSALVSAQNRVRYYWTNIDELTQPEDLGILLKDIIENGDVDRDKSLVVTTRVAGATAKRYLKKSQHQMIITGGAIRGRYLVDGKRTDTTVPNMKGLTTQRLEVRDDEKSNCISTVQKDSLCIQVGKIKGGEQGNRIYSTNGKSNTLNAHSGGTAGNGSGLIMVGEADIKGHDSIKRVYSPDGKSPTLTTCGGGNTEPKMSSDDITWRKLTPLECERLQTVPDGYTNHVSNSQRYRMLGNGWTIEVIKHIFKNLK